MADLPTYQGQLDNGQIPAAVASQYAPMTSGAGTPSPYVPPSPNSPSGSTPASSPAVIVTSGASKTNFNSNVTSLNNANKTMANVSMNDPSIVDFLNTTGKPSDYASRAKMAADMGITNYTGTAAQNTQMLTTLRSNTNTGGSNNNSGSNNNNNNNGASGGGAGDGAGGSNGGNANAPTVITTVVNPDGSSTLSNSDGSTTIKDVDGSSYNLPSGVDPTIGKQLHDNEVRANKDVDSAKTVLDNATALLTSDQNGTNPAAVAAANQIKADYGVLIQQMQDKNKILLGSYATNAARSGSLQYANDMESNFMSEEMDKATGRIADLTTKMNNAILKSNQAYESGDVKALAAAMKEYAQTKQQAQKALTDLATTVNNTVKTNQAQAKIDAKAANDAKTNDIKVSTSLAKGMADAIKKSGVTDAKQISDYVSAMAEANGITNPNILNSALVSAQQSANSLDLKNANIESTIKKRNQPSTKTPASTTYKNFTNKPTAASITKVNTYLASINASKADIDKVNSDEVSFYKVLNAVPAKSSTAVIPQ